MLGIKDLRDLNEQRTNWQTFFIEKKDINAEDSDKLLKGSNLDTLINIPFDEVKVICINERDGKFDQMEYYCEQTEPNEIEVYTFINKTLFAGFIIRCTKINNTTEFKVHQVNQIKEFINEDLCEPLGKTFISILLRINDKKSHYFVETLNKTKELKQKFGRSLTETNTIIHLSKSKTSIPKSITNSILEYNHSFQVRGHWREFNGIGKNRKGQRNINGYTWITPHIKGDGPLVDKIRIIN